MQSYTNIRALNVSNEAGQSGRGTDIARLLPAGQEASATVKRVSQNPAQPTQFTIQLQIGNRSLELITQRPLPQGSQIILSRDTEGNLQLRLPVNTGQPSTAQTTGQSLTGNIQNAPAQARAAADAFLLRITAGSVSQTNNLPLNQPVRGVVLAQPTVAAQAALTPTAISQALPLQTTGRQQPAPAIVQSAPLAATVTATPGPAAATAPPGIAQPATAPLLATPTPLANALSQAEPPPRPQGGFPVRILAAGQVIDLVSPRPIQAGQQVDVTRNEQGLLRLQITQPAIPLSQQPGVQAIMQQALREVLPVQLPLADGLNQLMQISTRQGVNQNSALNQLIQSMLGLFSVKPGSADADKAIARNLQQGGLLSEAGLNRALGERAPLPDLKQQLGQLLKLADQLPAQAREQLTQLINSLLARSTAQQISSLQRWRDLPDGGQERHFRLDLPIQQEQKFENAELRITEHRRRDEQGNFVTLWSVRLHFELEDAGSVDADISLQQSFQLSASFWVEKPETLDRLRGRLNDFEVDLKQKGFDVSPLHARLGKMANPEITPLHKRLVDVHT